MHGAGLRYATAGLAAVALITGRLAGQERRPDTVIEVGPNHLVSVPSPGKGRNEVWVAASRKDPRTFVAVFHADVPGGCESMVSNDGGQRWRRVVLPEEGDCYDPTVVAGANGRFYIAYAAWKVPAPAGVSAGVSAPIRVYTSLDDGATWSPPVNLLTPLRPDHQRLAVDLTGGPFDGRVYVHWVESPLQTVPGTFHSFLHWLDATGQTQSPPRPVHTLPDARPDALDPLVLSDGMLVLPMFYQSQYFFGRAANVDPRDERQPMFLVRSADGGRTFDAPTRVGDIALPIWRTRLHRFPGQGNPPIFAVDDHQASSYRDRLYAVWSDVRAGPTTDVWLIWSADRGTTWSAPVRVNDFAAPLADGEPPDVRMTPTVAINQDGIVGVAWYDRRDDPTRRCWKQYFAASLDGGRTFGKNAPLSTAASCPPPNKPPAVEVYDGAAPTTPPSWESLRAELLRANEQLRADLPGGAARMDQLADQARARVRAETEPAVRSRIQLSFDPSRSEFQGHYTGLAASTDGSFLATWADSRRGNQEIFAARVTVSPRPRPVRPLESRRLDAAVDVLVGEVGYDEAAGITTMQVTLRNRSDRPIYPPLVLRRRGAPPGEGQESAWDFSSRLGLQHRLDPGMITEPVPIRIRSAANRGADVTLDYEITGRTSPER